jgi:hypothetical protein
MRAGRGVDRKLLRQFAHGLIQALLKLRETRGVDVQIVVTQVRSGVAVGERQLVQQSFDEERGKLDRECLPLFGALRHVMAAVTVHFAAPHFDQITLAQQLLDLPCQRLGYGPAFGAAATASAKVAPPTVLSDPTTVIGQRGDGLTHHDRELRIFDTGDRLRRIQYTAQLATEGVEHAVAPQQRE